MIILYAFVAQATTQEKLVDKLIGELIDWVPEALVQISDLDDATLGKFSVPSTVSTAQDKLMAHGINPGPLGMLALTAIDANNRGIGMRNVAAMAARMPRETKVALSHLSKGVVAKAEALKKDEMAGATAPLGYFDPWGFSTNCNEKTLLFYREAELKHGRVAMLASLGIIIGESLSPIIGAKDATPAALLVNKATEAGPAAFWPAALVAASWLELSWLNFQQWSDPPRAAGDFGWDPLGIKPTKKGELVELQNKELNNGRLAMFGVAGIIAQEMVTGKKIFR